jgi:hypothetical protein
MALNLGKAIMFDMYTINNSTNFNRSLQLHED